MNILFIASESLPFVKTGGLADVMGTLPSALAEQGLNVSVMLPLYQDIPSDLKAGMEPVDEFYVNVSWRRQYCGLKKLKLNGITYYFIDNEYYFNRPGLYGFHDEAERYAFFSAAALSSLPCLEYKPSILHCNDWQTGLIPVFLKTHFSGSTFHQDIKTVFTIHNLHYRGTFPADVLGNVLGLPEDYLNFDKLEYFGQVSYLKGGLVYADILTTVSPSYAEEIQKPEFGEHLEGALVNRKKELYGVLNGIDYREFDPRHDKALTVNYRDSLLKKKQNKTALQEYVGLPVNQEIPLLAVISRLVRQKVELLVQVMPELMSLDLQMVVLGTGDDLYEGAFSHYSNQFRHKLIDCPVFDDELARRIYAASDIFLMPSLFEPCGLGQLIAMRYGSIPVVRATGGLKDTVIPFDNENENSTGFVFNGYNAQTFLKTIKKALKIHQDQKTWKKLVRNAVKQDFSWEQSAIRYKELYRKIIDAEGGNE